VQTCYKIRRETLSLFFQENTFRFAYEDVETDQRIAQHYIYRHFWPCLTRNRQNRDLTRHLNKLDLCFPMLRFHPTRNTTLSLRIVASATMPSGKTLQISHNSENGPSPCVCALQHLIVGFNAYTDPKMCAGALILAAMTIEREVMARCNDTTRVNCGLCGLRAMPPRPSNPS
jgi:hypothetical protein